MGFWCIPVGIYHHPTGIRDQLASGYMEKARRSLIWLQPSTMASSKPATTMRPSRAPWCPPWPCRWGRTSDVDVGTLKEYQFDPLLGEMLGMYGYVGWNAWFPWLKNWDLHNFGFCDLFGKPKSIFYPVTSTSDIHPSRWTLGSLTSTPSRWSLQTDRLVSRSVIERRSSGGNPAGPILKWRWRI